MGFRHAGSHDNLKLELLWIGQPTHNSCLKRPSIQVFAQVYFSNGGKSSKRKGRESPNIAQV